MGRDYGLAGAGARGFWNGEWGMGNGEWGMGNGGGEWGGMGNGEWGMGNGEWGMGNGEWGMGRRYRNYRAAATRALPRQPDGFLTYAVPSPSGRGTG